MHLIELTNFLESKAPLQLQEDYDNAGLIVGNHQMDVNGVLICLDALESVIDEAINLKCNVVISHHPIVFRGMKKFNGSNYIERTVMKAIKHDIAIYAIHTNLDNVYLDGVNAKIAQKIGLINTQILSLKTPNVPMNQAIGSGMIGFLSHPMPTSDFLEHLSQSMNVPRFKHSQLCKDSIKKVAVCGGSGSFLLGAAKSQNADIFITSDYKYHEFFDADGEIIIADIGHYESEKYTIELLFDIIINNFSTFATHCTKINTNPVNFF